MAPKVIAKPCPKCGSTERVPNGGGRFACGPCKRRWRAGKHSPAKGGAPDGPISIAEFLLNKKRAVCPVCRLKPEVAALVTKARKDGERGADIVEYLQAVHKVKVDPADFARHISQRHVA